MQYIYGTIERNGDTVENLKTVGYYHTELSGYISTRRDYDDGTTIVDNCRIVEHYHSYVDMEGNCYDWYEIDSHYRYIETDLKSSEEITQQNITDLELENIEHGQQITDLELMMLGGTNDV